MSIQIPETITPVSCKLWPTVDSSVTTLILVNLIQCKEGNNSVSGKVLIPSDIVIVSGSARIQKIGLCYSLGGALAGPLLPHFQRKSR